jgi:hypothetical protein
LTINGMTDAGDTVNFSGTDFTFNSTTYGLITNAGDPLQTGLTGTETIRISNASTVAFSNDKTNPPGTGTFGTLVMQSTGNDTVNYTLNTGATGANLEQNLDISAGGADKIVINNAIPLATDNTHELVVTGFNVLDDQIKLQVLGGTVGSSFQSVTVGNTPFAIGVNGILEIETSVAELVGGLGGQDTSNGGSVEGIIAGATQGAAAIGHFFVAMYASDGNAYLYDLNHTAGAGLINTANFDVQLIGQLNGVAANSLTIADFFFT